MTTSHVSTVTGSPAETDDAPVAMLWHWFTGVWVVQGMRTLCELKIPDLLAAQPQTAPQIAQAVGADPGFLYRLLRAMSAVGVLAESADHQFSLTSLGKTLQTGPDGTLRPIATFLGHPVHWQAWGRLTECVRSGQDALSIAHQHSLFELMGGKPGSEEFHRLHPDVRSVIMDMISLHSAQGIHALDVVDWSDTRRLVDVGGGAGHTLAAVLQQHPHVQGSLLDLPHMVDIASTHMQKTGVADRAQCVAGDFFSEVPSGADTYLLQSILHNLSDEDCVRVLRTVARAMAPTARLLVLDVVMPETGEPAAPDLQNMDMHMMVFIRGTRERKVSELTPLLAAAGLRIHNVVTPPLNHPHGVMDSVLEARLQ